MRRALWWLSFLVSYPLFPFESWIFVYEFIVPHQQTRHALLGIPIYFKCQKPGEEDTLLPGRPVLFDYQPGVDTANLRCLALSLPLSLSLGPS